MLSKHEELSDLDYMIPFLNVMSLQVLKNFHFNRSLMMELLFIPYDLNGNFLVCHVIYALDHFAKWALP